MEVLHEALEILGSSLQITGLVVVMMMMIEAINIESRGRFFSVLGKSRWGQVVFGAAIGIIPGCLGGFASVSLYTHGMLSIGALVATMIASSGDESFVMLAMFPRKAVMIMGLLFIIAIVAGFLTDAFAGKRKKSGTEGCTEGYAIHSDDNPQGHGHPDGHGRKRHYGWKRIVIALGLTAFIVTLATGVLGHEHADTAPCHTETIEAHTETGEACPNTIEACPNTIEAHTDDCHAEIPAHTHSGTAHINLLDEAWMNIVFAILSIGMLAAVLLASDHFVDEHLWHHVICHHLPKIFAWTFGVLVALHLLTAVFDISTWVSDNTVLMILLAAAIGLIPESGPHLIFVTLYAAGIIPMPVLLASCISQDGHASLPLLAENRKAFLNAKAINCAAALICGFTAMALVH